MMQSLLSMFRLLQWWKTMLMKALPHWYWQTDILFTSLAALHRMLHNNVLFTHASIFLNESVKAEKSVVWWSFWTEWKQHFEKWSDLVYLLCEWSCYFCQGVQMHVCSEMQHTGARKLILNDCVCNWITALFRTAVVCGIITNNCRGETMSLMSGGKEKKGDAKCGNDESRCVPESQETEISFSPLVWKRCQRWTLMASCLPVTGRERGSWMSGIRLHFPSPSLLFLVK